MRATIAAMWSVKPLSDGFGAEVHGADLGTLTDARFNDLERLFYDRQVLGIRAQELTPQQFVAFARLYRTIRYDRRGYGKSSRPNRPFSDVSDLYRLLRHLGINEAYLLGISNGGKVALEFALEHPGMVAALMLVGPSLGGYRPSDEKQRRISEILSVARERGAKATIVLTPVPNPSAYGLVETESDDCS